MTRKDNYYERHLQKYFDEYYGEFEETVEWLMDTAPNRWQFIVPELSAVVTLTCGSNGEVNECVQPRQNPKSFLYFKNKD